MGGINFHRVLLHIAGLGVDLAKFFLREIHNALIVIKQDGAGAGGTLIQGDDIFLFQNKDPPFRWNDLHKPDAGIGGGDGGGAAV